MSERLTRAQAAAYLTVSVSYLEKHRADGPPVHRVPNSRRVFYDRDELDKWMAERPRDPERLRDPERPRQLDPDQLLSELNAHLGQPGGKLSRAIQIKLPRKDPR